MRQPQPTPQIHHLGSSQQQQACCARHGEVTLPLGTAQHLRPCHGLGTGSPHGAELAVPCKGQFWACCDRRVPLHPMPRAHAPCEEHAGVHDGSPQDSNGRVLCLQLILPGAGEADGEVLPLVEHCGEVEVRGGLCPKGRLSTGGGTTHLSPEGGWTAQRR